MQSSLDQIVTVGGVSCTCSYERRTVLTRQVEIICVPCIISQPQLSLNVELFLRFGPRLNVGVLRCSSSVFISQRPAFLLFPLYPEVSEGARSETLDFKKNSWLPLGVSSAEADRQRHGFE